MGCGAERAQGPSPCCFLSRSHEASEHFLPSAPTNKTQNLARKRQNFHLDLDSQSISALCQNSPLPPDLQEVVPGFWSSSSLSHRATLGGTHGSGQAPAPTPGSPPCLEGKPQHSREHRQLRMGVLHFASGQVYMQHSRWLAFSINICLSLESLSPFQTMKRSRYAFAGGRAMFHVLQPLAILSVSLYSDYSLQQMQ